MPPVGGWNPRPKIKVLRITTLALAPRADRTEYQGPEITAIEDHNYLATDFVNTFVGRRHRRQILQTIVDLRNAQ
jgi:hypothetical protein